MPHYQQWVLWFIVVAKGEGGIEFVVSFLSFFDEVSLQSSPHFLFKSFVYEGYYVCS
jgi:hypothetical protein